MKFSLFKMRPPIKFFGLKVIATSASVAISSLVPASMAAAATTVDLELFLSMDVSGSISAAEFGLQKTGYVQAFQDADIQAAIVSKPNGVAVALGQWSSTANNPILGWNLLRTSADANAFATAINGISRLSNDLTCVACGINAAVSALQSNAYQGPSVIDVSGDGSQNRNASNGPTGTATAPGARNAAAALGIKINGLPILGSESGLQDWYINNVITTDGFVIPATSFNDFNLAVKRKIVREIAGDNAVPGPLPILGACTAIGFSRRLRKRINIATLA